MLIRDLLKRGIRRKIGRRRRVLNHGNCGLGRSLRFCGHSGLLGLLCGGEILGSVLLY